MSLDLNPSEAAAHGKLKRVYARLPLRVHSAATKGLARGGPGNPLRADRQGMHSSAQPDGVAIGLGWTSKATRVPMHVVARNGIDLASWTSALEWRDEALEALGRRPVWRR
jgi:hypothetical protein